MTLIRSKLARALLAATALAAAPAAIAAPLSSFVPFDRAATTHGQADASTIIHFQINLNMRDRAGLDAVLASHKLLNAAELDAYLPEAARHQAVLSYLRSQGVTIEATPASRMSISVAAPAALLSRLLGVNFVNVSFEGKTYVSIDREPKVPAALAPHIIGFSGLQPQIHLYPMLQFNRQSVTPLVAGKPPLYPSDLLTAYQATTAGTGAGTTTAIIIDTFPYTDDLTAFWATTGVAQSLSNITFKQVIAGTLPTPGGEESLDVEQSSSMAPSSKVIVYATLSLSNTALDTAYQAVITDLMNGVKITQVSMSYGGCETSQSAAEKTANDNAYATMGALGATVMASSGDSGARECTILPGIVYTGPTTPSFPSSSPSLAAIGGTTLTLNAASKITNETGWSGSGGGISKFFPTPSWQASLGYKFRTNPDVAADANPNTGVYIVYDHKTGQVGGTSVSSPVWAGLMGLVNAARATASKPTLGLLPSRTTKLVGTTNFRDITTGTNHGYSAGVGYDLVTGVGSPVMANLLPTLVAQP